MELRSGQARSISESSRKLRGLLLAADAQRLDLGNAAVISLLESRAKGAGRPVPQWVASALFDPGVAALLIRPSAELLWASAIAEDLIARSGCLRINHGRLCGLTAPLQARLDRLVDDANADGGVEDLFAAVGAEHRALLVAARETPGPSGGTVALVIRETDRESIALPDLGRLFGLTPTENQVVGLLLNGLSVAEIAVRQHNSELTVRTHLKRSYSKMNIRTKEQLFAKLLRLIAD